jgi:NADH-quinone oxidoreductase subunit J
MSRPRLNTDLEFTRGVAALALFVVLAYVSLTATFGAPSGFGEGSITASIGYAMFDLADRAAHDAEQFLVAFVVIAFVLDAALEGSIMLARREGEGGPLGEATSGSDETAEARADGGEPVEADDGEVGD